MCGIFGIVAQGADGLAFAEEPHRRLVEKLLILSESRGKDASGVALCSDIGIRVLKEPIAASRLIKSKAFLDLFANSNKCRLVMGHARMETNGSFSREYNNQPIIKDGCVTIHNGIIVNDEKLWRSHPELKREFEVDTEIVNALIRRHLREGLPLGQAAAAALGKLEGAYSIATLLDDQRYLVLATNTGSLYVLEAENYFLFASEQHFLKSIRCDIGAGKNLGEVTHIQPGTVILLDLLNNTRSTFALKDSRSIPDTVANGVQRVIEVISPTKLNGANGKVPQVVSSQFARLIEQEYQRNRERISTLQRCTKCILPETMPFIDFDSTGVCSYCRNYRKVELLGEEKLEELLQRFRRNDREIDCIIPFSGGRDSSYGVYYVKKFLRMNPVTFTYDWGMVTDLARRNIARICGKLGIENILISANIARKRENIRRNVSAWLHKPKLGLVPLFMAGDKQFLFYVNRVKRETGAMLDIWLPNRLEDTQFKVGYCGINPSHRARIDSLSLSGKLGLLWYYATSVIENPRYLNRSLSDTLFAYYSYYFEPRVEYHLLYDYIGWNERTIEEALFEEFDWERSPDTSSTWRIGDGTAPFYNYIYYTLSGLTEVDTFRSNQVREGMLSRAEALSLANLENQPRVDSLKWYLETIGLDLEETVRLINNAPKLYAQ